MMTWPLLYKLFNNKHTAKNPNIQMFRLRRKKQFPSGNSVLLNTTMEEEKGKAIYQHKLGDTCKITVIFLSIQET